MDGLDFDVPDSYRAQYYLQDIQKQAKVLKRHLASKSLPFKVQDAEGIIKSICASAAIEADALIAPIVAAEIHRAKQNNSLRGQTPSDRYESFFINHENASWSDHAKTLSKKYPDIFETLKICIENFFNNIIECLTRLENSGERIAEFLHINGRLNLTEILASGSDKHCNGRQVVFLMFQDGKRIVYKPRNLQTDLLLSDYIEALDLTGPYQPRLAKVVHSGPHYGWCEHISHTPCRAPGEIKDFHKNTGAILAILDSLNFTDGHHENFIACGPKLILIDCETILTNLSYYEGKIDPTKILFTGMLQEKEKEDAPQDNRVSGLHAESMELLYPLHPYILNERTDELAIHYRCIINQEKIENSPTGQTIRIKDYASEVMEGYSHTVRIIRNRSSKLKKNRFSARARDTATTTYPAHNVLLPTAAKNEPPQHFHRAPRKRRRCLSRRCHAPLHGQHRRL